MRFPLLPVAALLLSWSCVSGSGGPAHAALLFTAELTTTQEVGPVALTTSAGAPRPVPFGTATLSLNDSQTALTLAVTIHDIDVSGLQTPDTNDDLRAAHIHLAPVGVNGPVVWGFFGTPDNDINPDDLVVTPFANGVGGSFTSVWNQPEGQGGTTLTDQLPNLLGGLLYLNFHTVQNPGGEIRGQIVPVSEPGALALLGTALLALGVSLRMRRHVTVGATMG